MGIYSSNIDFNKYKIFYAVVESMSFSKAAEMLHLSQPGVSYAIKELEDSLNTKLFIRSKSGIKLTDDGEKLMFYVQKALNNIVKAEKIIIEREDEVTGLIRIGIYSHISLIMLPSLIKEFSAIYPSAKFSIFQSSNSELLDKFKRRELDFIVMQYPIFINDSTFNEEILCEMDNCFYATKELYDKYYNGYNDDNCIYPLILPFDGYADIDSVEEKLKRSDIKFEVKYRSYTSETLKLLVKQNLGIGWGIKSIIKDELKDKVFYEIPLPFKSNKTIYSIAYDEKFLSKTALEFIKYLKKNISKVI